jgi:hypothetical protein
MDYMGRKACEMRNAYKKFVEKPEGNRPLEDLDSYLLN